MIELSATVAAFLMTGFVLCIYVFFRLLVSQFERRLGERFIARDKQLALETKALQDLRQQVEKLERSLPSEYVRREDWIRYSVANDAKLNLILEYVRQSVPGGAKS